MKLFEPGRIGKLRLKNRIVMSAMGIGGLAEPQGRLGKRAIDYYAARAKGGVGLITTGAARVDQKIDPSGATFLGADDPVYIAGLSELADAVHDYGAKIVVQLTAGRGRLAQKESIEKYGAVAPSPLPCFFNSKVITRELTAKEIESLVEAFGSAARILQIAGIDGVELHAHDGYLLDQFQTPLWNHRRDKYGGDWEGRMRFPREIIAAIKRAAGEDFPIIYCFGLTHYLEGGRGVEEGLEIARALETAGVDAFHIDAGCYETRYWALPPPTQPPGCMVDLAALTKKALKVPVTAGGRLGYPQLAESILQEGKADFVALGRPLLADPDWPNKIREGRPEEIRPCIGCFEGCITRIYEKKYLSCAVNPATGMERDFVIEPAPKVKNVLIVGGGPAGMEAAKVAALRGHRVTVWEKEKALGGSLLPASSPDFKKDFKDWIRYQAGQLEKLGVAVEFSKPATQTQILQLKPDVLFVATGSLPMIPEIPGVKKEKVVTAIDILLGKKRAGKSAVIIGGGLIGCETALYLSREGKGVTLIEILSDIAGDVFISTQQHMKKLLADVGAKVLTETRVLEIREEGALISDQHGQRSLLAADSIILAVGMRAGGMGFDEIESQIPEVYAIGDCVTPRRVIHAIWEGFRLARLV